MNHTEASSLLTALVSSELEAGRRQALEEHLAECEECRNWVAAAQLLSVAIGEGLLDARHPSSTELVGFALEPETLAATTGQRVHRHLAECQECRDELRLVQTAVVEARQATGTQETERMAEPSVAFSRKAMAVVTPVRLGLAAAALLTLLSIWAAMTLSRPPPEEVMLSNTLLEGAHTVSARRSITVKDTQVSSGARVVLDSGKVVAFGDGFSVQQGATLKVSAQP